jgi:hypothetical protein
MRQTLESVRQRSLRRHDGLNLHSALAHELKELEVE